MPTPFNQLGTTQEVLTPADLSGVAKETTLEAVASDVTQIKTDVAALVAKYSQIVVTCLTQDDVTVTGQTVTLRAGDSSAAAVYATLPYNGQPITFEVPRGFRYFVEVTSSLSGHYAPTTAQGVATTGTVAVTLTYSDTSHISTFADVQAVVAACTTQDEGRAAFFPNGAATTIADTWTDENGTVYNDPMIVQDVQWVVDPEGRRRLAAILMRKYATKNAVQFDAPEQQVCTPQDDPVAVAGIYYWGYGAAFSASKTYAANALCAHLGGIWKCVTAITTDAEWDSTKWTLVDAVPYSETATYAVGDYAKVSGQMYNCTTAVGEPEAFDPAKWTALAAGAFQTNALVFVNKTAGSTIDYASYGCWFKSDVTNSSKDPFVYGYDSWRYSALREYLNSSGDIGEWWVPSHVGDCPPNQATTLRGYKAGCSAALLAAAKPIRVPNGTSPAAYTEDTFFAPSGTELYGLPANFGEGTGEAFKYIKDATGWSAPNTYGETAARRHYTVNNTSATTNWRTRNAKNYQGQIWTVGTAGKMDASGGSVATASIRVVPCCAIY